MSIFRIKSSTSYLAGLAFSNSSLTGCASSADSVMAANVSPMKYRSYTCNQIEDEMYSIQNRVEQLTGKQNKKVKDDKIATGVGIVIFWPALFSWIAPV